MLEMRNKPTKADKKLSKYIKDSTKKTLKLVGKNTKGIRKVEESIKIANSDRDYKIALAKYSKPSSYDGPIMPMMPPTSRKARTSLHSSSKPCSSRNSRPSSMMSPMAMMNFAQTNDPTF